MLCISFALLFLFQSDLALAKSQSFNDYISSAAIQGIHSLLCALSFSEAVGDPNGEDDLLRYVLLAADVNKQSLGDVALLLVVEGKPSFVELLYFQQLDLHLELC
jgi:hypothetical protein